MPEGVNSESTDSSAAQSKNGSGVAYWGGGIKAILDALGYPFDKIGQIVLGPKAKAAWYIVLLVFVVPLAIPLIASLWLLMPIDWAPVKFIRHRYVETVRDAFGVINSRVDYFHSFQIESSLVSPESVRVSLVEYQLARVRIEKVTVVIKPSHASHCSLPPTQPTAPILTMSIETAEVMKLNISQNDQKYKLSSDWWTKHIGELRDHSAISDQPSELNLLFVPTEAGEKFKDKFGACAVIRVRGAIEVYKETNVI